MSFSTCMEFTLMQFENTVIPHKISGKPWEIIGANIFTLNSSYFLYSVDYCSKFPIVKRAEDLLAEQLITCRIVLAEFGVPCKIMPEAVTISDKFKTICQKLNIEQGVSSQ